MKDYVTEQGGREKFEEWVVGEVEAPDRDTALKLAKRRHGRDRGNISVISAIDDELAREDAAIVEANQKRAPRRKEGTVGGIHSDSVRLSVLRGRLRRPGTVDGEQDASPGEPSPRSLDHGAAPEGAPAGEGPRLEKAVA